jgi:uncharacterized protein (DUF302 family)
VQGVCIPVKAIQGSGYSGWRLLIFQNPGPVFPSEAEQLPSYCRPGLPWPGGGWQYPCLRGDDMTQDSSQAEAGVITKLSPRPVADTVARLTSLVDAKGMKVFAVIDQRAEAVNAGLELRATTLVIFGSPAGGTPVMAAVPLAALDLPLKVLVWEDEGQAKVSYVAPAELAARHHLSAELAARLAGIDPLTDALVAP